MFKEYLSLPLTQTQKIYSKKVYTVFSIYTVYFDKDCAHKNIMVQSFWQLCTQRGKSQATELQQQQSNKQSFLWIINTLRRMKLIQDSFKQLEVTLMSAAVSVPIYHH